MHLTPVPPLPTAPPSLPFDHSLFRSVLPSTPSSPPLPLSAASLQASRLCAHPTNSTFIFSTSSNVYTLTLPTSRKRPRRETTSTDSPRTKLTPLPSHLAQPPTPAVSDPIADDYIVPTSFSDLSVSRFVAHCTHQSEVQSVAAEDSRVASVDAYGRCIITVARDGADGELSPGDVDCFVLPPVSLSCGEPGWAGVSLKNRDVGVAVVARQLFRDVTLYDRDVPVRTVYSICKPGAVKFCNTGGSIVSVAEGAGVSFYDFRAGERGGCVGRKDAGRGVLLGLDVSEDGGLVATGGMERILHVFDVRTMTVRDRWTGCLKYEIAGTLLSREMDGMAYVCSVDNEVACGAWSSTMATYLKSNNTGSDSLMISGANTKSPRRAFGFRGDVRLTGITRRNLDGEEIAVMSEAGAFYLLRRERE